jgi:hypothetical protein
VSASHLLILIVFSALVASVFAALLREDLRSQLRFGLGVFAAFVLAAVAAGWLMYPFPS